ncbi:hypothetical protein KY285_036116 [Solanum tuberosum]|nr:hypothetical protein KY289_036277 [Solanum tuberosum]KAH0639530.1 hypothetical protein KY285_036116 [Solanum tuberosum]
MGSQEGEYNDADKQGEKIPAKSEEIQSEKSINTIEHKAEGQSNKEEKILPDIVEEGKYIYAQGQTGELEESHFVHLSKVAGKSQHNKEVEEEESKSIDNKSQRSGSNATSQMRDLLPIVVHGHESGKEMILFKELEGAEYHEPLQTENAPDGTHL